MKNTLAIITLLLALSLTSCNNAPADKSTADKEKELLKKELELAKKELELKKQETQQKTERRTVAADKPKSRETQQTTERVAPPAPKDIHDDPLMVVQAIFDAAQSHDVSQLSGLCDPTGSGDGDTKALCNVGSQTQQVQDAFISYFQNGRIIGNAVISENRAKVKIKFGPDGTRDEEMNLVKVNGKWYLSDF